MSGRALAWEGILNVRDLGGLPLAGGGTTRFGEIVRSAHPAQLTAAGWGALRDHGIRTIVDLRTPGETPYSAADGIRRVSVPVLRAHDPELDALLAQATAAIDWYVTWVEHRPGAVAAAVRAIGQAPPGTVLVHCQAGRDRTGVVCALLLASVDVEDGAIAEDYAASAEALQAFYADWIARTDDPVERERLERENSSPAEAMHELLRRVRSAHGDVRAYLRHAGVADAELDAIRRRLAG